MIQIYQYQECSEHKGSKDKFPSDSLYSSELACIQGIISYISTYSCLCRRHKLESVIVQPFDCITYHFYISSTVKSVRSCLTSDVVEDLTHTYTWENH